MGCLSVLLLALLTAVVRGSSCPTITRVMRCPACAVAQCVPLSTVTVPCGCATPLATTTTRHHCDGRPCGGGCVSTYYTLEPEPSCPPTKLPCPAVTLTAAPPGCTPQAADGGPCVEPMCISLASVTVPCDCTGAVSTTTSTLDACTCRAGCATSTELLRLPCPTTPA